MNTLKKLFLLCIGFIFTFVTNAQQNPTRPYAQKIGLLDSLYSKILKEKRDIYVQLPRNYNPDRGEKYPVVYILDGEALLPPAVSVHDFYSGGFIPEMIMVGISNRQHRTRDLTTSEVSEMYGAPVTQENGKAAKFIRFLGEELLPFIESKYRTTKYRTLIGHSYGGLFTIYTLVHHSKLFSSYIAIDPSLNWDNQKLVMEAKGQLATQNYKGKSLFMSLAGQLHMQNPSITIDNVMEDTSSFTLFSRSNITLANYLKEHENNGLSFTWKFYPNDLHGTIPLPSIKDGLLANFQWFQMEKTHKFNTPETSKEELAEIIKYRANKLQKHFGYPVPPYPEELMTISGNMSLDMGQLEKAKMFFELAIKYYPNNATVFIGMADYYERNSAYSKALEYVKKAASMSKDSTLEQRIRNLQAKIKKS